MKIQKDYRELLNYHTVSGIYIEKNKKKTAEIDPEKESENKIVASIKRFNKQMPAIFDVYNDLRDDMQLNNCSVDEKTKVILKDKDGNRQYTVAAEKKLKQELKDLIVQKVECHARIAEGIDDLILTLNEAELEAFSGIVIPEQPKEAE